MLVARRPLQRKRLRCRGHLPAVTQLPLLQVRASQPSVLLEAHHYRCTWTALVVAFRSVQVLLAAMLLFDGPRDYAANPAAIASSHA